jgi:hypothetical protein
LYNPQVIKAAYDSKEKYKQLINKIKEKK